MYLPKLVDTDGDGLNDTTVYSYVDPATNQWVYGWYPDRALPPNLRRDLGDPLIVPWQNGGGYTLWYPSGWVRVGGVWFKRNSPLVRYIRG